MSNDPHCSFVLLAEFDIDRGAQLTYQFPQPLGTDDGLLANLMLPDGAEKQLEDWTIFFLNQTPFNTIAPVLALEPAETHLRTSIAEGDRPELLYVLNLVRTKHDKTVRRGAVVKAMAICTRHPFIQIFKPVLLMALDDYFADPSQECLARLFDAVNSMDISGSPKLNRYEKLVMRTSERKDIFSEKFASGKGMGEGNFGLTIPVQGSQSKSGHRTSWESRYSAEGGRDPGPGSSTTSLQRQIQTQNPRPSTDNWNGDDPDSEQDHPVGVALSTDFGPEASNNNRHTSRGRSSTDASSTSSSMRGHRRDDYPAGLPTAGLVGSFSPAGIAKDTHFYQTSIAYKGHTLPIKLPLSTFSEEVGDYSLIQLIQTFSSPQATITGPLHPHLHINGSLTHPIIVLFNALVTGKRIIFLGYNRPAGQVSSYVLSACALGSGCGCVLRGFIERAFPYANLLNRDEWESISGYIAGVTNPIFESSGSWDLLCDVGSGRMVVSKDIHFNYPVSGPGAPPLLPRTGTLKAEMSIGSDEDISRSLGKEGKDQNKSDFVAKADSPDNVFMEDIISAISYHFGEGLVRARFTEYVTRFVRLASRWEEDASPPTTIGFPSATFSGSEHRLGSGIVFLDEASVARDQHYQEDFKKSLSHDPIQGFDVSHQMWRLRHAKGMSDAEAELIMRKLVENMQTYDQLIQASLH